MIFLIVGAIILTLWIWYIFVRPIMAKRYPETFDPITEIWIALWRNSKTMLAARLYTIGGILLAIQTMIVSAGIDTASFVYQAAEFIPEKYRPLAISAFMTGTGLLFAYLRKNTHGPLETPEIDQPDPPDSHLEEDEDTDVIELEDTQ
jgi:hypothetical protein